MEFAVFQFIVNASFLSESVFIREKDLHPLLSSADLLFVDQMAHRIRSRTDRPVHFTHRDMIGGQILLEMAFHFMKNFSLFLRNASPRIQRLFIQDAALSMCLQIVVQHAVYEKCRRNREEKSPLIVDHRPVFFFHHRVLADHVDVGV